MGTSGKNQQNGDETTKSVHQDINERMRTLETLGYKLKMKTQQNWDIKWDTAKGRH